MKSLQDFIIESSLVYEENDSVRITFNFTGLENVKDTIESLKDREGVSVDGEKVTITINQDNVNKLGSVQDILQQYTDAIRGSQKRSSDEQYAQKTKSFADKLNEFNDALDKISNPDEEDDENKDDDKDKDKEDE